MHDDEPRGDDFIVSFKSYLRPDRAHQIVHDALHGQPGCATSGSWRVLPRRNAAYRLPSDFALVRLQLTRAHRRRALRALRRHSSVRLLSPERRYASGEPMPSKRLQSHAEQEPPEPSPRHAEPASLGQPAHSLYSYRECGADADAAYGVERSGRLGRGRPGADFSFAAKCSSGGGGGDSSGGGGDSGGSGGRYASGARRERSTHLRSNSSASGGMVQLVHTVAPTPLNFPAGQKLQSSVLFPALYFPASHAVHWPALALA